MRNKTKYVSEHDLVPDDWHPKDKPQTIQEWGQREYTEGFRAGSKSRAGLAILVVMDKAKLAFEQGNDEEARKLREMAGQISKVCEEEGYEDE